jgi:purine-binding chemotaxis protein CheW
MGSHLSPQLSENTTEFLASERRQFITFTVQAQEYGIDIMSIREIKGWTDTTSLPNSPDYMRGVINLRGTVVPILDLRARFYKKITQPTKNHVVMIVSVGDRLTGILVDSVSDILTIPTHEIRPIPKIDNGENEEILSGLVSLEDRMVGLLILETLFDTTISFQNQLNFDEFEKHQNLTPIPEIHCTQGEAS